MGKPVVLRLTMALVGGLLLAACTDDTSVTTMATDDPRPTTTMSASTTTSSPSEATSTEPPVETTVAAPPPVSFEEIAGRYRAKDPGRDGFLQIMDDGRLHWAPNEDGQQIVLNARFEGTNVLITDPDCGEDVEGIYEIHVFESGDLAVVLIEDGCPGRAGNVPGEYTPTE